MAKKISKFRSKTNICLASSAAVLLGALYASSVHAQNQDDLSAQDAVEENERLSEENGNVTVEAEENDTIDGPILEDVSSEVSVEAADDDILLEEVVVFGIKQSLQNAQDMKRDAATVVDVITSSDITALPDNSVVDALARVPGVTIEVFEATDDPEHFGAEGSTALVRGLNRTITQFNGRTSFSASQWGALNLSHIPSELVGSIEVQKNQTASMIEGGIAGTLNLVTRKPFDNDGMVYGGSFRVEYGDVVERAYPSLSGLFSNRWDTDIGEVGWLVSVSGSQLKAMSQGVGVHNFYEQCDILSFNAINSGQRPGCPSEVDYLSADQYDQLQSAAEAAAANDPDGQLDATQIADILNEVGVSADGIGNQFSSVSDDSYWLPPSLQFRSKEDKRDRLGVTTSLQWASPDDRIQATLEFIHSSGTLVWSEYLIQNKDSLGDQFDNATGADLLEIPGYSGANESFGSNGLFTHGVLALEDSRGYEAQTRHHDEETTVNDISLDLQFDITDNLTVNTDVQYVDSELVMFDHTIHNQFDSDVWIDLRNKETPQIGFIGDNFGRLTASQAAFTDGTLIQDSAGHYWGGDTGSITDPNRVYLRSAMDHNTNSTGEALAFSADVNYEFEDSWITNIKGGIRFSEREQVHKSADYDWGVIAPEWSAEDRRTVADYPQFQQVMDFGGDFHGGDAFIDGSVTQFYVPRLSWAKDLAAFEQELRSTVPLAYDPTADADNEGPDDDPTFHVTEEEVDGNRIFETLESRIVDGKAPGSPYAPNRIYTVEESAGAAYVQMDFDFVDLPMPIRGNVGLRYVDIAVTSSGSRVFADAEGTWVSASRYVDADDPVYSEFPETTVSLPSDLNEFVTALRDANEDGTVTAEERAAAEQNIQWLNGYEEKLYAAPKPYSAVLPSLNVVMNITDDLLLRFGASKAIYIPHLSLKRVSQNMNITVQTEQFQTRDFADEVLPTLPDDIDPPLKSVTFQDYTVDTVESSNPYLQPEEAINVDLSLEWYFADVGSVSGVLFKKDMENLIRRSTYRADVVNPSTGFTAENVLHRNTYDNVGSAEINGIELSYQQTYDMLPGYWSGLGLQLNFTYLDTKEEVETGIDTSVYGTFVDLPLEGLSDTSYNFIVFYENELFNTRLAYNYRSSYMLNDRDVIGARPVYNDDRATLDFSFNYNVSDNVKATFSASNLTDEQTRTSFQHNSAGSLSPRNYFVSDRRISFGISGSF